MATLGALDPIRLGIVDLGVFRGVAIIVTVRAHRKPICSRAQFIVAQVFLYLGMKGHTLDVAY